SKRSVMHWMLATFLLCLSCASRRIARELGVHSRTSYRWCWWLRNAALSYEMGRQLEGTVEADDLYHTAGQKGQAKQGGKQALGRRPRGRRKKREPGRGHYDKDRPAIIAWVSRHGTVVVQGVRDFTHSPKLRGKGCHHSSKASGSENLEVEEPVACWDCSSFHFYPTLPGVLGSTLIGDQVREVRQPCEKRLLAATGMMLIPSDFVVHSFRPPMEEAMSRLWSQLG